MYSIIVVPTSADPSAQIRLAPGETLHFGRSAPADHRRHLLLPHTGVSRSAGEITCVGTFWSLSNFSRSSTYVVENPEGAGEHIKIAPGRVEAPVPFEFSRIVLPAGGDLLGLDVWAPRHEYVETGPGGTTCTGDPEDADGAPGEPTVVAFPLDRGKRYFLVLTALCEPRLRGRPHAPLPTVEQVVARLRPIWPEVNRAAVQWNIGYLAVKLRLRAAADTVAAEPEGPGFRLNGKKDALVSLALRFDLVREEHLAALAAPATERTGR
ncbi:FHA domain-containing protein [Kitasatospora sp. NPDC093806]|uniref:FHA domain-containing protein n=1 Tax=Kitasatospora sp. NPDC093806 TaxID=3155075 RepID=UPI00344472EC